jgi:hypothetical protein
VTGSQTRARQAAEALITGGQAHGAVLEQAVLGLGAGSMTYGHQRTGCSWHALISDGHVTWTRSVSTVIERENGLVRYFTSGMPPQRITSEYDNVREEGHPDHRWTEPAAR